MDLDPQNFYQELDKFSSDNDNGPVESHRRLNILNRYLIDAPVDSTVIDSYLIYTFQQPIGLLNFIESTMKKKWFYTSTGRAIEILFTMLNNIPSRISDNNIVSLFELSMKVIRSNAHSNIKFKIFDLLLLCFEKIDRRFDSPQTIDKYKELYLTVLNGIQQSHNDTIKQKEMMVVGHFAKKFPYLVDEPNNTKKTFMSVLAMQARTLSPTLMNGFFDGFSAFCESFPMNPDINVDGNFMEQLYKTIKNMVVPKEKKKTANRAALFFLARFTHYFQKQLLSDFKFWHKHLLVWLTFSGKDDKTAGASSLKALFQLISSLLEQGDGDECKNIVLFFNNWSKDTIEKTNISNYEKRLAIYCMRQFSAATYKHLDPEDVTKFFIVFMKCFECTYVLSENIDVEEWEYLPDYVQTVANLLQFKTFTTNEFFCLQRVVINMIKSFHNLPYLHYNLVIDALVSTMFYFKKSVYFDVFMENIVYQGVVWSCSHSHLADDNISEELKDQIVTIKKYFPLWMGILKMPLNRTYDNIGFHLEDRKFVADRVVKELIKTLMILINKLNVGVKLKEDNISITDLEHAYMVEELNDYAIFLNVVDFYQVILDEIGPKLSNNCILKIIKNCITKCIQHPLISGFYKLLSCSLKVATKSCLFDNVDYLNPEMANCKDSLSSFLSIMLGKMYQYKDELLVACLQVLLGTPICIMKDILPTCVSPLMNIFDIGKSCLILAEMGLDTLEHWQDNIDEEILEPILIQLIPNLDSFLRSKSLGAQTKTTIDKRRKTMQALKKRKVLFELEPELVRLQHRILSFIGRQSLKICHAFIFSESVYTKNTISGKNTHLKITLPYEDIQLDMFMDAFLPRVVELSLYCSDRQTRVVACELLQALVMVFLGRAKVMDQASLEELNGTLTIFAMPLLQLGCDVDQVVQQIFEPLFLQLIHWYTSRTQLCGSHSAIIIDVLMEGITHPVNSALRDFSGKCVREFVKWTVKQSSEKSLSNDPVTIKVFVKKIRFFSSHPDQGKKLGAALIFNSIYKELREEDSLISIFWIELLYIFISSLSCLEYVTEETATTTQIKNALHHLQRVLVDKHKIFSTIDDRRRIPNDLRGGLLKDVAVWLLQQTTSKSRHCRECCMHLFIHIAPISTRKNINLNHFVRENIEGRVVGIFDKSLQKYKNLTGLSDGNILLKWMHNLLCTLDGYNFVVKNNLGDFTFENNILFEQIELFLQHHENSITGNTLHSIAQSYIDKQQFEYLESSCCLSILKLYNKILHDELLLKKSEPLWSDNFYKLILNTIFNSQAIGFESNQRHKEIVILLLNALPSKLSSEKISVLVAMLENHIHDQFRTAINLKENVPLKQRNMIKGILLLAETKINDKLGVEKYAKGVVNRMMLSFYAKIINDTILLGELDENLHNYCSWLLKYSLGDPGELECFFQHLYRPYTVESVEFTKEMYIGLYFLHTFTEAVLPSMLENFELFVSVSIGKKDFTKTVEHLNCILKYISNNKMYSNCYKKVCDIVFSKWSSLTPFLNESDENYCLGLELIKLMIPICSSKLTVDIYKWLVESLIKENNKNVLEVFNLVVQSTDEDLPSSSLEILRTSLFLLAERIIPINVENEQTNHILFSKMLLAIPLLKSSVIMKFLLEGYVKTSTTVDLASLLLILMSRTEERQQSGMINVVYAMCCDMNKSFDIRYKLAKEVLCVLLHNCKLSTFTDFYVHNILSIVEELTAKTLEIQIVNFILVEKLFFRHVIGLDDECVISRAANQPKLLHLLVKMALDAFKYDTSDELSRLFKCHAYNALASMVSNALKDPGFYSKLFIRRDNGEDILWHNIIKTDAIYNFPISFDRIPTQRKMLVNIRDELHKNRYTSSSQRESLRYIESQRLFNSSLNEDVTKFDFTNVIIRSENKQVTDDVVIDASIISLEATDVNAHECMATICGLIKHMFDTGIEELPKEDMEEKLPVWMNGIRETLLDQKTHNNVKIFLVKVIDNMLDIFNHFSKWFLEPLLRFVIGECAGRTINYFVTDVLIILSRWSVKNPNITEKETVLVSEMLDMLVKKLNKERLAIFKYNLDMIKLIVESWKSHIRVPIATIWELISADDTSEVGIHLASVFMVNKLKLWDDHSERPFFELLLKKTQSPTEALFRISSETLGVFLRLAGNVYVAEVNNYLVQIENFTPYVNRLEGITVHFPAIINAYHALKLLNTLNHHTDNQKVLHLKIILNRTKFSLDLLDEIQDFRIIDWHTLMEDANLEIQIITLEIVKTCLPVFVQYEIFDKIVETLLRNVMNPNVIYRNSVYDIAILLYHQGSYIENSKEILVLALADPDNDNREKIRKFWSDQANLPNPIISRFSYLLCEMYKPRIEDRFLGYLAYYMICILEHSEKFDSVIFEHPLEKCEYEEYKLQTNWRLQHKSLVPMFAETLQTDDVSNFSDDTDYNVIRQTQTKLDFTPTQNVHELRLSKIISLEGTLDLHSGVPEGGIKNPNNMVLSHAYRRRQRFLKDKAMISRGFAHYETTKKVKEVEKMLDSAKEREKKVVINRSYRKGDFPDIQIALSSILQPLQLLVLRDSETAKILFLEIFRGLNTKVDNNDEFLHKVFTGIKRIFDTSTCFNSNLFGSLLDILLKNKDKLSMDPKVITYVCQESGIISVGALLLEEYISCLDYVPSYSKRGVSSSDNSETAYWVKLAELYKELEEWDMVRAIFLEKMNCKETIQNAIEAESTAKWRTAQDLYHKLIETDMSLDRKDFYYESFFKCFANLGEWEQLPTVISSVVESENTWEGLWDNDWCQQKLLPWYITAHLKSALFYGSFQEATFLENINKCLTDPERNEYLKANFSEELCMMWLLNKDIPSANLNLKNNISYFLDEWQYLNPMFYSLRYSKLLKLRNIIEVGDFAKLYDNLVEDYETPLKTFLDSWKKETLPTVLLNETRVLYRTQFINLLTAKLSGYGQNAREQLRDLKTKKIKMDIDLINIATEFNNFYISRKYYAKYRHFENSKLQMACANITLVKSRLKMSREEEISDCLKVIIDFNSLLKKPIDKLTLLSTKSKVFDIFTRIGNILDENPNFFDHFKHQFDEASQGIICTTEDIQVHCKKMLKEAVETFCDDMDCDGEQNTEKQEAVSKAYLKLAYFIRDRNKDDEQADFILFVLRAMKIGSIEAIQMFPCLLMQDRLAGEYGELFAEEATNIPTWMFLGWLPQLLAIVDTPKISAISKILIRVAETYPQAIMYPYRLSRGSYGMNNTNTEVHNLVERLDKLLLNNDMVNKFLKALSYVSLPLGILRYYVIKMLKSDKEDVTEIQKCISELFESKHSSKDVSSMQGNMFQKIDNYKKQFTEMNGEPLSKIINNLKKIQEDLRQQLERNKKHIRSNSKLLKDYCPWLANFSAYKLNIELEIPGQYDGQKMPNPQYHVKIAGFCPHVTVMSSLRQPIKLTMIGMDTKEYPFLVKFGEDIRQDQRIEQLFNLMNNIFNSDRLCANNGFDILTYQVIPLTSNLGIIQWINDTSPLSQFMTSFQDSKKLQMDSVALDYQKWIGREYGIAAEKIDRNKTLAKFNEFVNRIPKYVLKQSFQLVALNVENYIALRNNFIKSYSVMCVCQWILGIGDRHLDNSLIYLRTGKVLGIDFGHAFGTATQILVVPELVPFRLTPHIVSIMEPLGERGHFKEYMIHCLRALRNNSTSLLATMHVFIQEPSLDWLEHANDDEFGDVTWYPNVKIEQAKRKLQGETSTNIMIEELHARPRGESYVKAWTDLVRGVPEYDVRAKFATTNKLSCQEQVDCLIDHATDYNLLGRMYVGWRPFV